VTAAASNPTSISLDADVVIYAAAHQHPLGRRVRSLFHEEDVHLCGSTMLLPEVLIKPSRLSSRAEVDELGVLLAHLDLWPATAPVCTLAVSLGAAYGLPSMDAVHLATAVEAGADAFLTNNRRDFSPDRIGEIAVVFPDDLPR
jgi:predicted nucleic acid-binding protein